MVRELSPQRKFLGNMGSTAITKLGVINMFSCFTKLKPKGKTQIDEISLIERVVNVRVVGGTITVSCSIENETPPNLIKFDFIKLSNDDDKARHTTCSSWGDHNNEN